MFKDLVKALFLARDVWASEVPAEPVRDESFVKLAKWIMTQHGKEQTSQEVLSVFDTLVQPNSWSSYSAKDLEGKLTINANRRLYRVVSGADSRHGENDFRVRNFLVSIFDSTIPFHPYALICPFFSDYGDAKTRAKKKDDFKTGPATRFEKLLFIATLAHLSGLLKNKKKKRKVAHTGSSSDAAPVASIPSLTKVDGALGQRIGVIIQRIVVGWNKFCTELGLGNAERFILPYVIVTDQANFRVLKKEEGFAKNTLFGDTIVLDSEPTLLETETCPGAFNRPDNVDILCRRLVSFFLSDISNAVRINALFEESCTVDLLNLDRFEVIPGQDLPLRFSDIDSALISEIRATTLAAPDTSNPNEGDEEDEITPLFTSPPTEGQPSRQTLVRGQEFEGNTEEATEAIEEGVYSFLRMHDVSFENFLSHDEVVCPDEQSPQGCTQLVLTDPPYNVRRERGAGDADYDSLTKEEMKKVVDLVANLLRPGGHAVLFCSVQQFPSWERYFSQHETGKSPTFAVDKTPMLFAKLPSAHNGFPGRASCSLQNAAEFAVHAKKNGLRYEEEAKMVNYENFNFVRSAYPAYKNVINNVPRLAPREQVRTRREVQGEHRHSTVALRAEQKSLPLLMELVSRFTQPGDLVVDLFAGTFSSAAACFSLKEHRRFAGCESDPKCNEVAIPFIIRKLAAVLCSGNTDLVVSPQVLAAAAKIFAQDPSTAVIADDKWVAPNGLPPFQRIPMHIAAVLSSRSNDVRSVLMLMKTPIADWPPRMQALLEQVDVLELRNVDAATSGLFVAKSTVKHPKAGLGVFAAKAFQPGQRISPFYGTIVYHNLADRPEVTKSYATSGIMGVTVERFKKMGLQVDLSGSAFQKVRDFSDGKKAVTIIPAPFCVSGYINEHTYREGDEDYEAFKENRLSLKRTPNAVFLMKYATVTSPKQLLNPELVYVQAEKLINPGDEIFVDYNK